MRILLIFLFLITQLFSIEIIHKQWKSGRPFLIFLKKNNLPVYIYYGANKELKKDLSKIRARSNIYILKDKRIEKLFIDLNKNYQIKITYNKRAKKYNITKIKKVVTKTKNTVKSFEITKSFYIDAIKNTLDRKMIYNIIRILSDRMNFRHIKKGTKVILYYKETIFFGKKQKPIILGVQIRHKKKILAEAFLNPKDSQYYNSKARAVKGMFLPCPLNKYKYISSPYGYRFHPILHKKMMHWGIDYAAKPGTPIHAVADGKVIYKGWMRGYGRVVEIRHKNHYMTIYAHMKKWGTTFKRGNYIKQGTVIGYVGSSGRSTGPHLHFGVAKNDKWINPKRLRKSIRATLKGKEKRNFLKRVKKIKQIVNSKARYKML